MFKSLMTGTAALALAATAAMADTKVISEIDVEAELSDVNEANALEYWPDITTDLGTQIAAAAEGMLGDNGYTIDVQLTEISLSGSDLLTGEGEFNTLEGWVYIRKDGEAVPVETFEIALEAETLSAGGNSEITIIPGKPMFYTALVNAFAMKTVEAVEAL